MESQTDSLRRRSRRSRGFPRFPTLQRWLVYLLLVVTPFSIYPAFVAFGSGVKPFHAVGAVIGLVGLSIVLVSGRGIRLNPVLEGALGLLAVASLSLVGFVVAGPSMGGLIDFGTLWFQLSVAVLAVVGVSTIPFRERHVRNLTRVFLGVAAAISAYAIYQTFARMYGLPFAYPAILNPSLGGGGPLTRGGSFGPFVRPSAFFTEPSRLGAFLLTPLLVNWFLLFSSNESAKPDRWFFLTTFAFIVTAFVLAFSLGAYIALAGAVATGLFFAPTRKVITRFVGGGLGAVAALSAILYPILDELLVKIIAVRSVALFEPFFDLGGISSSPFAATSIEPRLERMMAGFEVGLDHPFLGVGLNNFGRYFPGDVSPLVHSGFVASFADMGMLGPLALAVLFTFSVASLHRVASTLNDSDIRGPISGALSIAIAGRALQTLVAMNYLIEFLWLDLALAVAVLQPHRPLSWGDWSVVSATDTEATSAV